MRAVLVGMLAWLLAPAALAQQCPANPAADVGPGDAWLCWVNATQGVTGQPLPGSGAWSIVTTRIQHATVAATATCMFDELTTPQLDVAQTANGLKFVGLGKGRHCWRLRHISLDPYGNEFYSGWSATVYKVIPGS